MNSYDSCRGSELDLQSPKPERTRGKYVQNGKDLVAYSIPWDTAMLSPNHDFSIW